MLQSSGVCAVSVLAGIAAQSTLALAPVPSPGIAQQQPARAEWWFPHDIPTGRSQDFEVVVDEQIESGGRTRSVHDGASFTVAILPGTSGEGCRVRIVETRETDESAQSLTAIWLRGLTAFNPRGVDVGPSSVSMNGGDLLRGPWRQGDRFSIAGFVWFFGLITGVTHYEVTEVNQHDVVLSFSFWVGAPGDPSRAEDAGPEVAGDGTLRLARDAAGIVQVSADWKRTHGDEQRRVQLRIRRTADRPIAP